MLKQDLTPEVKEFWAASQRQSHSLHEISYRACYKAELPEYFIRNLTSPGDVVADPFLGRGTTVLQAHLMGRLAHGSDINPLSAMLLRPRLNPPTLDEVRQRLYAIPLESDISEKDKELEAFYHPETLSSLVGLKTWFSIREIQGSLDKVDDWIRMVSLSRLSGHSPGFFSVRTLPPNQAVSIESQKKINIKNRQIPQPRDVRKLILNKTKSLLRTALPHVPCYNGKVEVSDARHLFYLENSSIDLFVTSPPFLDIVDYKHDNWLRCWFGNIDLDSVNIDSHRTVSVWRDFIGDCIAEMCAKLKPGGHIAFEVGEIRKGSICLEDEVQISASGSPLDVCSVIINQQKFTKTSNLWGTTNNTAGTNSNRIVLFQKH